MSLCTYTYVHTNIQHTIQTNLYKKVKTFLICKKHLYSVIRVLFKFRCTEVASVLFLMEAHLSNSGMDSDKV